jgi:molybdopterin biosynthesis enzyme
MTGRSPQRTMLVRIAGEAPGSDPRETWWPATVRTHEAQLVAEAIPWKDSSDVTGLARANALLRIPKETPSDLLQALLFGSLQ